MSDYETCYVCGCKVHIDDAYYDDDADRSICEDCIKDIAIDRAEQDDERRRHDYSYIDQRRERVAAWRRGEYL